MDPIKRVKEWWGENVNAQPVWRVERLPDPSFKDMLLLLKLAYEIRRDTIVLGKPGTELSLLFHSYFWEILSCILEPYAPYVITGIAAIHFHLDDESIPNRFDIITMNSSIQIGLHEISFLSIEKNSAFFQSSDVEKCIKHIKTKKNYVLTIESPESLLVRLRPQYFRDYPQVISGFLKTMDFDIEILRELLLQKNRPIIYFRLAALFEQMGKNSDAELLRSIAKATTHRAAPGKAQILKYPLPLIIASPKRLSDPAYVARFRDQLRMYAHYVDSKLNGINFPRWNVEKIKLYIEKNKTYDTYHSSTIEGYRVTTEEIQLLIEGQEIISTEKTREEIERKMALKGYLDAHQFVLQAIEKHFNNNAALTELMIRDIYAHLFSPSIEAGILKKGQLVQYRNDAVFIRNSRYVPPNYLKVNELMRCLVEEINGIENSATQAIIAHYGFVTVHPYFDGNGRVARFLMNYLLCRSGIPWATIRVEDRQQYFGSLEIAQCDEDVKPFLVFLEKYLKEKLAS